MGRNKQTEVCFTCVKIMKIHVLAGDALADDFKQADIKGETIVCRECFVEGDVNAASLNEFWQIRAKFITSNYDEKEEKYFQNSVGEFERLRNLATSETEVNLWFEYDLFCQVNLWFCLYLLRESNAEIFRVAPVCRRDDEIWEGFGGLESDVLERCFADRVKFNDADILLGANLWRAYQFADFETLEKLSETNSACFPYLREVCRAAIEKNSRPKEILQGIIANGTTDFAEIFPEFSAQAGVYGFGDAQVQRILAQI